ncbi:SDR family NAD(P)-dependent oxidoreductase [Paracoccus sp. N5]|uniref:SDR family NAD(P)-dependent oxidoreductase n=1 Tax=Paracoccus sp. N5 TaxID=1101189 RepID=UPI0003807016|nr:SDR family NAD(P)-dependent oxidoreductase [Paracoccus sp. N5]
MSNNDFSGRKAIVTGGASGIGYGVAERLVRSGATVCLWDYDPAAIDHAAAALDDLGGARTSAAAVDVIQWDSVQEAAAKAAERLGGIDILVNSAGVAGLNAPTWDYPVEEWSRVIDINLTGTFHACKAVTPFLTANGWGRVANIASVAGKEGNPNAAAYAASKGGIIAFTKALGKELATTGVLVNCITPAAIDTPLLGQSTPEFVAYMKSKIPMGRFGRIEEVAAMVAWMCSEDCSFTTGAVFDLSGGRSTY